LPAFDGWKLRFDGGELRLLPRRADGTGWVFGSWEDGLPVWKISAGGTRTPVQPDLEKELPDPLAEGIWDRAPLAVRQYQATVPLWAWGLRLGFGRYLALRFLAKQLQARDLSRSHPLLFALIIHKALASRGDPQRFAPWFGLKRREILGRLGLPAQESVVRLLSRLDPAGATRVDLTMLKASLESPILRKLLSELDGFPLRLIELLRRHPGFFDTRFFRHELAQARKGVSIEGKPDRGSRPELEDFIARLPTMLLAWREIQKQAERVGKRQPRVRLSEIGTWEKVLALSRLWARVPDLSRPPQPPARERGVPLAVPFPPPVVPPNREIRAVPDSQALLAEGEAMSHCVGTYTARILRRQCDIYHVAHAGEHATLEIRLSRGRPQPGELRSFENRHVSPRLRAFVGDWFREETGMEFVDLGKRESG